MAVNRERPHLLLLPEDDATRSLAIGFADRCKECVQVLQSGRGWPGVLKQFEDVYINHLRNYESGHLVLVIDFDNNFPARLQLFQTKFPPDIADRVFVLGPLSEVEVLQREAGLKKGPIGQGLALECQEGRSALWLLPELAHNQQELERLRLKVKPFVF